MAVTTYTVAEIKALVLSEINTIDALPTSFTSGDSDKAYDSAVRECGFENPTVTDDDRAKKYEWLIKRMRRYYLGILWQKYLLKFKSGDLESQQLAVNLKDICTRLDEEFEKAKADQSTAHLFTEAETIFGVSLVVDPGFIDNRVGEGIEDRT